MYLLRRHLHPLIAVLVVALSLSVLLSDSASAAPTRFDWPVGGTHDVTRVFDPPPKPWLPGHRGVDIAGEPGAQVLAAGDGIVSFAGAVAGKPVVSIDHGGIRTTYEPVIAMVQEGESVALGQPIGTLQSDHPECTASACLHWGAKRGETYIDPLSLLRPRRVRLLPL